jgi:hypothetical protein
LLKENLEVAMAFSRCFADVDGVSHFEDLAIALTLRDFAPPARPFFVSPMSEASGIAFVRFPAGWEGDWHPTAHRQFFIFLEGEFEGEAGDGTRRNYRPGSGVLLEDTVGFGHRSWVVGSQDVLAVVVQVPDAPAAATVG